MKAYAHEVLHSLWGSNLANQLSAEDVWSFGEDGKGYKIVTVRRLFGGTRQKKKRVGHIYLPVTDNDSVKRQFHHRCGLINIFMAPHRNGPMFVVFLDGHVTSNFASSEMEFRFAPDDLKENDGNPIAEVWFQGKGPRRGPFSDYTTSRIVCTFSDLNQMNQYLEFTNRQMSKSITHQGVTYSATSGGEYESSDGSLLPCLLMVHLLLPPVDYSDQSSQFGGPDFDGSDAGSDDTGGGGCGDGGCGGD